MKESVPPQTAENFHGFELLQGERVEIILRKYWLIHFAGFLEWVLWAILPSGSVLFAAHLFGVSFLQKPFLIIATFLCMYIAFVTLQIFVSWMNSALDVIVVTNDRIVCIDQVDFFHREIVEARLENIQDATGSSRGFLCTMLNLGEIKIRTANDISDFSLDFIEDPHARAREIFTLSRMAKKNEREGKVVQKEEAK